MDMDMGDVLDSLEVPRPSKPTHPIPPPPQLPFPLSHSFLLFIPTMLYNCRVLTCLDPHYLAGFVHQASC